MMIPQVETPPAACQLSVWMSTSHDPVVLFLYLMPHLTLSLTHTDSFSLSHPQIKEAADIIQKLHLIAQELPFDR